MAEAVWARAMQTGPYHRCLWDRDHRTIIGPPCYTPSRGWTPWRQGLPRSRDGCPACVALFWAEFQALAGELVGVGA